VTEPHEILNKAQKLARRDVKVSLIGHRENTVKMFAADAIGAQFVL
jgi:hypothetical protein